MCLLWKPARSRALPSPARAIRRYVDVFEKRQDPRGKTYYWLSGELLEDVPQPSDVAAHVPTDVQAIRDHYISLTPLQYNLTSIRGLASLARV